jgi:hypothetical protein
MSTVRRPMFDDVIVKRGRTEETIGSRSWWARSRGLTGQFALYNRPAGHRGARHRLSALSCWSSPGADGDRGELYGHRVVLTRAAAGAAGEPRAPQAAAAPHRGRPGRGALFLRAAPGAPWLGGASVFAANVVVSLLQTRSTGRLSPVISPRPSTRLRRRGRELPARDRLIPDTAPVTDSGTEEETTVFTWTRQGRRSTGEARPTAGSRAAVDARPPEHLGTRAAPAGAVCCDSATR